MRRIIILLTLFCVAFSLQEVQAQKKQYGPHIVDYGINQQAHGINYPNGLPGFIWCRTEESEFAYTDGNGTPRGIQGLPTGVTGKKPGQPAISGTEFRYIANDGNEYAFEGALLSAAVGVPDIWIPDTITTTEFQYTDENGDKRYIEGDPII